MEKRLVHLCKQHGCLTYKFTSPGHAGVPDRIVITPTGETCYVEVKTKGGRISELQSYHIGRLREQGARVWVAFGREDCETVMQEILS